MIEASVPTHQTYQAHQTRQGHRPTDSPTRRLTNPPTPPTHRYADSVVADGLLGRSQRVEAEGRGQGQSLHIWGERRRSGSGAAAVDHVDAEPDVWVRLVIGSGGARARAAEAAEGEE